MTLLLPHSQAHKSACQFHRCLGQREKTVSLRAGSMMTSCLHSICSQALQWWCRGRPRNMLHAPQWFWITPKELWALEILSCRKGLLANLPNLNLCLKESHCLYYFGWWGKKSSLGTERGYHISKVICYKKKKKMSQDRQKHEPSMENCLPIRSEDELGGTKRHWQRNVWYKSKMKKRVNVQNIRTQVQRD